MTTTKTPMVSMVSPARVEARHDAPDMLAGALMVTIGQSLNVRFPTANRFALDARAGSVSSSGQVPLAPPPRPVMIN